MPKGPFGEILGTTGTLDSVNPELKNYDSKVVQPRNPKLIRDEEEPEKLKPSQFMFQMSMDTEKKLANTHAMYLPKKSELLDMGDTTHQRFSQVDMEESIFQPFPSALFFMNCEPHIVHELPLTLRNNDKVPRLVKVTQADSPYFRIVSPNNVGHKVAPGLSTVFTIEFIPDERRDYTHELKCVTEREKFIVPVQCIGARAVLDFPDEVNFSITPVKYPTMKTLLVRNVGNRIARFSLSTEKPFRVTPENGILEIHESMQIDVEYCPQTSDEHIRDLVIHYDTGENIFVQLYGVAQDVNVRLDKNSIRVENTYIGLANVRTVTLHNRSDVITRYRWTKFGSRMEENLQRQMMQDMLSMDKDQEMEKFFEECGADPTLKDKFAVISRTFLNKKQVLEHDGLFFEDEAFKIDPLEGEIWPNSYQEISVTFRPSIAKLYQATAFCDVTGREAPVALKLAGQGIGPRIDFSFDSVAMGYMFVGSSHTYELVMANKGDIDAIYKIVDSGSNFSSCFQFTPDDGIVTPGGHQAIHVKFKSSILGEFNEEFRFLLDGAKEEDSLSVRFSGTVIGPTFHFDTSKLKFGTVSYGFTAIQSSVLHNSSLVDMQFKLRVPGDGTGDPLRADDEENTESPRTRYEQQRPREFHIEPDHGVLSAMSSMKIKVSLTSNCNRKYNSALVVDVEGVGDEVLSLPISARSTVPSISVASPLVEYNRCFLDYPYEKMVSLANETDLPAKYELLPQETDESTVVYYHSPRAKGIVPPKSLCQVPLVISVQAREEQESIAFFKIFGSVEPPLGVQLTCFGEGPVVHVDPSSVDWGQIQVLVDNPYPLLLSNESLIPAKFSSRMTRPDSAFRVEPAHGEIPPQQSMEIMLTANLTDCVRFRDKLEIHVRDNQSRIIELHAYGFGTTVVSDPPMTPQMMLGPHFSQTPFDKEFKLTNSGRRHQQLVWSTEGYSYSKALRQAMSAKSDVIPSPVFSIVPHRFDLAPGASTTVHLVGQVDSPQVVKERLLCHAIIGRQGGKELIKKVDVCVDFISPVLSFSSNNLYFRVDKKPQDTLDLQTRKLQMTNVSSLTLNISLMLKYPFQLLLEDGSESSDMFLSLEVGESTTVQVQFDPAYKSDLHIRTVDEALTVKYDEHPHVDHVALRGEVYFPNLSFEHREIDFGCILNHTEVTRYLNVTNTSPMPVRYRFSFLEQADRPSVIFHRQPRQSTPDIEVIEFEEQMEIQDRQAMPEEVEEDEGVEILDVDEKDHGTEKEISNGPGSGQLVQSTENGPQDTPASGVLIGEFASPGGASVDVPELSLESAQGGAEADGTEEHAVDGDHVSEEHDESPTTRRPVSAFVASPDARPGTSESKKPKYINPVLESLLEQDNEIIPLGIEEVFDVLPLYGEIAPGQTEQLSLTFFGHPDIEARVQALCEVEGGPTYEIDIKGEASLVEYRFDTVDIDYHQIPYDQVACAEITLFNSGKVGFSFAARGMPADIQEEDTEMQLKLGQPIMVPSSGFIPANTQQRIKVKYLPGVPERFERSFEVQVAHFEADTVHVCGEGTFPRISLDLPRSSGQADGPYASLVREVRTAMNAASQEQPNMGHITARGYGGDVGLSPVYSCRPGDQEGLMSELEVQLEVERRIVAEFAQNMMNSNAEPPLSFRRAKNGKVKPRLPDYVLDFGFVVLGHVRSHIVRATNTGWFPASFWVERDNADSHGFNVVLEKVRKLPGAPDHETLDFVVNFDPRGANLGLGPVETSVILNLLNGPQIAIILRAHVTMPDLTISTDILDFAEVKCGESKVVTVQLYNPSPVRSEWTSQPPPEALQAKKAKQDKFTPMHLRRRAKSLTAEKTVVPSFEMIPSSGELKPGQRVNVQVKFTPTEERRYEQRMALRLHQSSQRTLLLCKGQGLEPKLEFEHNLVTFGPVLPFAAGDEQTVIVKNPCSFPIEFYNLEFDKIYLEEEKILRQMSGYDEHNTLLLPPRAPGEKLPQELLDYYEEQVKRLEEMERQRREAEENARRAKREAEEAAALNAAQEAGGEDGETAEDGQGSPEASARSHFGPNVSVEIMDDGNDRPAPIPLTELESPRPGVLSSSAAQNRKRSEPAGAESSRPGSEDGVGELEITPVSSAIARYLGIDLSPEGKAARNRRGVALIVHGPPLSGKTSNAVRLAKRYEAALLTIDRVIIEAIANGNTPAGLKARERCAEAAKKAEEAAEAEEGAAGVAGDSKKPALSMEAVAAHTQGTGAAVPHSVAQSLVSNRKTSTVAGKHGGGKDHSSTSGPAGKAGQAGASTAEVAGSSQQQQVPCTPPRRPPRQGTALHHLSKALATEVCIRQAFGHHHHNGFAVGVPSSPPPLTGPVARKLSISASVAGEESLMSTVLPEDLLVEILSDRLQLNDCHKGVVFDGLETLFSPNMSTTAQAILKALNNRRYIYFVTLKLDYQTLKDKEKSDKEEAERQAALADEAERIRLEEMSEDEYDALSEEEKAQVDERRLKVKRERRQRELAEKAERERLEREEAEAEQRRLEDEKKNRRGGKKADDKAKGGAAGGKAGGAKDSSKQPTREGTMLKSQGGTKPEHGDRPESHATSDSLDPDGKKKKKDRLDGKSRPKSESEGKEVVVEQPQEEQRDPVKEAERLLQAKFKTFEIEQKVISDMLAYWDRTVLSVRRPPTPSAASEMPEETVQVVVPAAQGSSGKKGARGAAGGKKGATAAAADKGDKADRSAPKDSQSSEKAPAPVETTAGVDGEATEGAQTNEAEQDSQGVPHIVIDCSTCVNDPVSVGDKLMETGRLPSPSEVMDGLGLGAQGPPIPPAATFSVLHYPTKRQAPATADIAGRYQFVASSLDDPNILQEDRNIKEAVELEEEKSVTPDRSKDETSPTKARGRKSDPKDNKANRKTSGRRGQRRGSGISSPPTAPTPQSDDGQSVVQEGGIQDQMSPLLGNFRWIVPANGEVVLKLRFKSEELGQYDQTLNFEILDTKRRYQLYCRGICSFPTISREPRIVFPHRKKSKKPDEIVQKKYILTSETFEFGPLLVGKTKEKVKDGRFPENIEKLTIQNTSPLEAEVNFCLLNDVKGETYAIEPSMVSLQPGESQELTVWAFPKTAGQFEDAIICCVRENPEPIIFNIVCDGVRPKLDIERNILQFEKVLLHRKDTKTLYMRNSTLLPLAWRIAGLEALGDDFSISQDSGVIEAKSEFSLNCYFRAMKPYKPNQRKSIRLEVYDLENIMGLVQTENIQVTAEAYDVALDMSFPKGADGGIDFGVIRVSEDTKQTVNLKNKGPYEIVFHFVFETGPAIDYNNLFSINPQRGSLSAGDKSVQVVVSFKSKTEIAIKDQPILRCQVVEPSLGQSGEMIASIPIRVSVRSVFSKFNIAPQSDINFGAIVVQSRKTRQFVIENRGEFDFKYNITRLVKETIQREVPNRKPLPKDQKRARSRDGSSSGRSVARPKKTESLSSDISAMSEPGSPSRNVSRRARQDAALLGGSQGRLQLGMFTVSPAIGVVPPNNAQIITVDCIADIIAKSDEELSIDISDRDPKQYKDGIPYRLFAESCAPSINCSDIGSIFEEHRICKNLNLYQLKHEFEVGGIFGEEENRFLFSNVIVGTKARARFRVSNPQKVPCDVGFAVKQMHSRSTAKLGDVFEVEPTRTQIPPHGYVYATVTFAPPSMQFFLANFEANVEGAAASQSKSRTINFEVAGEGNLPRITVQKPTIRNKRGQPLCQFRKLLLGRRDTNQLVLLNDGTLPSRVDIDLLDPDEVFAIKPAPGTEAIMNDGQDMRQPHTASLIVNVDSSAVFNVSYSPNMARKSQGQLKITVVSNQYEDSIVQLVGEGFEDDISFENMPLIDPSLLESPKEDNPNTEDILEDSDPDDVSAAKHNLLHFGDCYLANPKTQSFTLSNHSPSDTVRFSWPTDHPQLKFAPATGHLHGGQSRNIVVTFKADQPITMQEKAVLVKLVKINLGLPEGEKPVDWDDMKRTMKWVDIPDARMETGGPRKRKVVETEPEPSFTEISETSRTLDLLVSARADYCKVKCKQEAIKFKDTLMFQTRQFEFALSNKGSIGLDFNWRIVMETESLDTPRVPSRLASAVAGELATTDGIVPFTVVPEQGRIPAGGKANILLKFSPLSVSDFEARLVCHVPNLEDDKQGPAIAVRARSAQPFCHLELEDSDYLSGARRNPALRGPGGAPPGTMLDPNTRVIEMHAVGVGVQTTKVFDIVNPTKKGYDYHWQNCDALDVKEVPAFKCMTVGSHVLPGKKVEQQFEFAPSRLGISESFWRFVIPEHNISVPFLIMGESREPNIAFDRSHFNFRALLIGHQAVETVHLINPEETPFHFAFEETSMHAPGYSSSLKVEPSSGIVPPRSKIPIDLTFVPNNENEVNFTLVCNIKKKTLPITLNVKAEGYTMRSELWFEEDNGHRRELEPSRGLSVFEHNVDLGQVEINEETTRAFFILNNGKFNFDYTWTLECPREEILDTLTIEPRIGNVQHGEKARCQLTYHPKARAFLRNVTLRCKISNGPDYLLNVTGSAVPVGVHFSFTQFDFGPRFVYRPGMELASTKLLITNRDRRAVSVDCLYTPTAQLQHDFQARVIAPDETVPINLTFFPRDAVRYCETLKFEINGMSQHSVEVTGEGTEMRVEVKQSKHKMLSLGVAKVGETVKRVVPIVNNSLAPITFRLAVTPSCHALVHDSDVLKILPQSRDVTLAAKGGTAKVEVIFSPRSRIPKFTEEVFIEAAAVCLPLFAVTGCCHGYDIQFDMEAIAFGAVVKGSQLTKRLMMMNLGDIGAKFHWDEKMFAPDFTITPTKGYISPGMEVPFDITFTPQKISSDIRYDNLMCRIEGSKPMPMILTGMCIQVQPVKETQHFSTYVRHKDTKPLQIINRTNATWLLKPVIEGDYWSGPETLVVDPQQTRSYELTYRPLTMTLDGKRHQGSVFFALPDGTGLLYNVTGTADPPKANAKISRDIPCKTAYTEILTVSNWLRKPQRFKVARDMVKADRLDPGTHVSGLDYVDVPGNSKRDYKLHFSAHREGLSQIKVVFTNDATGEFQFYELTFRAGRPASVGTIHLTTPVRQAIQETVTLENPLNNSVTFSISTTLAELHVPTQLQIPALSSGSANIEFCPLREGDYQGKLEFSCSDLGLYTYELDFRGTSGGPERALHYRTHLGGHQTLSAKFMNHAKQRTDYTCKVDNPDFHCDKTVAAAPAVEVGFEVVYQPSRLGESRGTMTVSSPIGGDYQFPLHGSCLPPKPQGPINVKSGATTSITFRNVFPNNTPFTFQVDNPAFHLTKNGDSIRPNKDYRIVVGYDGNGSGGPVMGKLIVSCARSAGQPGQLQWIYYLRGTAQ